MFVKISLHLCEKKNKANLKTLWKQNTCTNLMSTKQIKQEEH